MKVMLIFYEGVTMEMVAILDFVCPSWKQNIFVINAPNEVIFVLQLAESIPQGVTRLISQFLKSMILTLFIFYFNSAFYMPLYKHCLNL